MDTAIQPGVGTSGAGTAQRGRFMVGTQPRGGSMARAPQQVGRPSGAGGGRGLANTIGWVSIGLGLAQLAAPRGAARLIGVRNDSRTRTLMRAVGLREIASGVGILSGPRPTRWAWTRVAGDAMDLALLRNALASDRTQRARVAAATAAVLGIAALDVRFGQQLTRAPGTTMRRATNRVQQSVTVDRPPAEVYNFWHDFENLPRFMRHLESVQVTGEGRSHWKAKGPAGATVEWDAEITDDRPNELIAWRSVPGSDVNNAGSVRFRPAPGGRGTEVTVEMRYEPPGGALGAQFAKLFRREPGQEVHDDLRAFKQVMETGEVLLSDATVHQGPHPASPPEQPVATGEPART